jgi:hypothetical protein
MRRGYVYDAKSINRFKHTRNSISRIRARTYWQIDLRQKLWKYTIIDWNGWKGIRDKLTETIWEEVVKVLFNNRIVAS